MSRRSTLPSLPPGQPITEEALKTILVARFGKALLRDGYTVVPNLLLNHCREVGMTPTEFFFWETVIQFQHDESLPWPSVERIAHEMGKSYRTVERYIKRLETKELLRVERSPIIEGERPSNRYDFSPLYERVIALDKPQTLEPKSGLGPLKSPIAPDTFVGELQAPTSQNSTQNGHQNGHITPKMPTELSAELTAGMADKEDESQEESLQEERDSNLRSANAQTSKGRVLNGSSNPSQQQPGKETSIPNQTSNNTNKPNTRNENENTEPQRTAAAPPAWSNVPTNGQAGGDTPGTNGAEKPAPLPRYAANYLDDLSKQFGDQSPKSSQTRAAKIYAKLSPWGVDEYFFVELMTMARDDTSKANITKTQKNGRANRMPYFLKVLDYGADYNVDIFVKEAQEREARQREAGEQSNNNEGS